MPWYNEQVSRAFACLVWPMSSRFGSSFFPLACFIGASLQQTSGSLSKDVPALPKPTAEQNAALEALNGFRSLHGLKEVRIDRRLLAAAAEHAAAMAHKEVLAHKEDKSERSDAKKRSEAFGYSGPIAELVASGIPDAPSAVVNFIDAPYHRRLLLKPGGLDFGCSADKGYVCFVLGGTAEKGIVCSPPTGADGVPTSWDGQEEPNPARGTGLKPPFGYPILVAAYGGGQNLTMTSAAVAATAGGAVPCIVRNPGNDPECTDCIIIVPQSPLQPRTSYTVTVAFRAGGVEHKESWSFRTGSE